MGNWGLRCARHTWLNPIHIIIVRKFHSYLTIYIFFSIDSLCPLSNLFLICCFKSLPFNCSVVVCCSAWSVPLVFGINGFCFNQSCLEFSSSPPEWLLFFQRLSVFFSKDDDIAVAAKFNKFCQWSHMRFRTGCKSAHNPGKRKEICTERNIDKSLHKSKIQSVERQKE